MKLLDKRQPRKPTEAEKAELVSELFHESELNFDDYTKEYLQGFVDDAYIAVFDHYMTESVGYAGKVMVVIAASAPGNITVWTWPEFDTVDVNGTKSKMRMMVEEEVMVI